MTHAELRAIVADIRFNDWTFHVGQKGDVLYFQVHFYDALQQLQHGRKWLLSEHMTASEVVLTAFKAVITALEHEARETFTYKDRAILGPHIDVEALIDAVDAARVDVREVAS